MPTLNLYLTLCRAAISAFAACSAATGYFLASSIRPAGALIPAAAVFLLACGASAFNQFQERAIDAAMKRTLARPLPTGAITPARAAAIALILVALGSSLLGYGAGMPGFFLGLLSLAWYNGIYTRLKKITAFASIPGAVVGMIPPAIGWISAGGSLRDPRLAAVCFIFFMWQVPHFWLLLLNHGEDYERAGLPTLTRVMSRAQMARLTFAWIVAASIGSLALPLYGSIRSPLVYFSLIPLAGWVVWNGRSLIGKHPLPPPSPALFRTINIYLFLIMSLLSLDGVLPRMP